MDNKKETHEEESLDFSGLILGFSSAALYYLGQIDLEDKAKAEINLPLAKQNIDIILLLKEKTKGNLSQEEQDLLESLALDLQEKFSSQQK